MINSFVENVNSNNRIMRSFPANEPSNQNIAISITPHLSFSLSTKVSNSNNYRPLHICVYKHTYAKMYMYIYIYMYI